MTKGMCKMNEYDAVFFYKLAIEEVLKDTDDLALLDLVYRLLVEAKK